MPLAPWDNFQSSNFNIFGGSPANLPGQTGAPGVGGGGGYAPAGAPRTSSSDMVDFYRQQMLQLSQNPSSITSMPGWKAGEQAVQRSMAAQGYQGSGNMMTALQDFGGDFYMKQMQMLASMLGGERGAQLEEGRMSNDALRWNMERIDQNQANEAFMQGVDPGHGDPYYGQSFLNW